VVSVVSIVVAMTSVASVVSIVSSMTSVASVVSVVSIVATMTAAPIIALHKLAYFVSFIKGADVVPLVVSVMRVSGPIIFPGANPSTIPPFAVPRVGSVSRLLLLRVTSGKARGESLSRGRLNLNVSFSHIVGG
jgi:hypothetical protein